MINQSPKGGTELQLEYLSKYVDKDLLDKVQITTSVPEKIPLHPTKPNVLWQKNSWDQPNIYPWFNDPKNTNKYDMYVFNSHWNLEQFRKVFKMPLHKCTVIKNGIDEIPMRKPYQKGEPIKLIHHCTPWRGLSVLLGAMQLVKSDVTLDVYSSCEVYGKNFAEKNDPQYQALYDQAKQLKNVNYIGYKPNSYIKEHLKDYHMFVYPSIWEETSCISAIESMAAGLYCVLTDFGALYETCAEYALYIPFDNNYKALSQKFAYAIDAVVPTLSDPSLHEHLMLQSEYARKYYGWSKQAVNWKRTLEGLLNAK